ncbi:hypothetical protein ACW6QP_00590 [Salegentibacter sp. HM20]
MGINKKYNRLQEKDLQGLGDLAGQEITAERFEKIDSPKKNYKKKQASKRSETLLQGLENLVGMQKNESPEESFSI